MRSISARMACTWQLLNQHAVCLMMSCTVGCLMLNALLCIPKNNVVTPDLQIIEATITCNYSNAVTSLMAWSK
jgi:hypothetical protein